MGHIALAHVALSHVALTLHHRSPRTVALLGRQRHHLRTLGIVEHKEHIGLLGAQRSVVIARLLIETIVSCAAVGRQAIVHYSLFGRHHTIIHHRTIVIIVHTVLREGGGGSGGHEARGGQGC